MALASKASSDWFNSMYQKFCYYGEEILLMSSVENGYFEIAKCFIDKFPGNDAFDQTASMTEGGGGIFHCIIPRISQM